MKITIAEEDNFIVLDNGHHRLIIDKEYMWQLGHNIANNEVQTKLKMRKGDTLTLQPPKVEK